VGGWVLWITWPWQDALAGRLGRTPWPCHTVLCCAVAWMACCAMTCLLCLSCQVANQLEDPWYCLPMGRMLDRGFEDLKR